MSDEPFNAVQLQQLRMVTKEAVREEMADAGLRLEGADHQDEARADFRFVRWLRKGMTGVATAIGMAIILAVVSAMVFLVGQGLNFWRGGGGP